MRSPPKSTSPAIACQGGALPTDIVGPPLQNNLGKRYICIISDYATRNPEAITLCTIDVVTVAQKLLNKQLAYKRGVAGPNNMAPGSVLKK